MKLEANKPHSIHLRLNDEQFNFLAELAKTTDLTISDLVRVIVNTTMYGTKNSLQTINAKLEAPHADDTNPIEHKL